MEYQKQKGQPAANNLSVGSDGRKGIQLKDNRSASVVQKKTAGVLSDKRSAIPVQRKENNTGLPGPLKSGIENLSGVSMDDVKVHYNSDRPLQLNAHAFAQGTDIHVASGQEKHLPHEAWHVVQQKQGRVKPTIQLMGKLSINDDTGLERDADRLGEKALQLSSSENNYLSKSNPFTAIQPVQRKINLVVQPPPASRQHAIDAIYLAISGLFAAPDPVLIKTKIGILLDRPGDDGHYDLTNQAHRELLYHQVQHLLNDRQLGTGVSALAEKPVVSGHAGLGTDQNPFQLVFLGGGASIAYYVSTLGSSFNFTKTSFVYTGQPWRSERGPGVVAHPEHMISPLRTYLGISMGDKGHAKMDKWMLRSAFSDLIEGVITKAEGEGATHIAEKIRNVTKEGGLYKITLSDGSAQYSFKIVSGLGAGGHIIPQGLSHDDLHDTSAVAADTPMTKLIMNMDVFTQIAGHLKKIGGDIVQSQAPVPNGQRGDITLVLSGGNAALDVAYDALAKGYKVKWITGSRGATFLPGFLNQAAALPHAKALDPRMPAKKQEALKKEITRLYQDQHLQESGVSETDKLQKVIKGRATSIKQQGAHAVKAVVEISKGKTEDVTGDLLVFAIGPDLSPQKIFSDAILQSLIPLADKGKRFSDSPADTHLAVGTPDRSLQIVGGGAFRFTPPVKDMGKVTALAMLSEEMKNMHGTKRDKAKKAFTAAKEAIDPEELKQLTFSGPYKLKDAQKIIAANKSELERKTALFKASSMEKVPDSLPGNVLISDQLTGILTQTEALNEAVPHDVNLHSNFLIDDRTILRIHLSSKMPRLADATVGDEVVKAIIDFRSAETIGPDELPPAVPPFQEFFQKAWEATFAEAKNHWSLKMFTDTFVSHYGKYVSPDYYQILQLAKLCYQLSEARGDKKRAPLKARVQAMKKELPDRLLKRTAWKAYKFSNAGALLDELKDF